MSQDFTDALAGGGDFLSNLFGAGSPSPVTNPVVAANTASDAASIIDPTNAAQAGINAGQPAPTTTQAQNQQGQGQNPQGQNQNQQGQNPVALIQKALRDLARQKQQNPWLTGGPPMADLPAANAQEVAMQTISGSEDPIGQMGTEGPEPGSPTPVPPWFKWAGGRPFSPPPWQDTDLPGTYSGGQFVPEQPAGGPETPPPGGETPPLAETPAGDAPSLVTPEGQIQGLPPPGGPSATMPPPGGPSATMPPWYGPFPRTFRPGIGVIPNAILQALQPTPLQSATGVEAPRTLGRSPSGPAQEQPGPEDPEAAAGGPGHGAAITTAPETGKPIETVDPKDKKPVDPKTGEKLPTKKDEPREEAPSGEGPILRDMRGGQSVPLLLGQIAQIALPLLMMGLMGGFGGGRRGGFKRVGAHFGHPRGMGGRNYWPYHHPTYGWRVHGYHPGGEWREMHPRHFQGIVGFGFGGGPLGFAGGQPGGGGARPQQADMGPQGGGGGETWRPSDSQPAGNPNAAGAAVSADDELAMIRQRESGGTNQPPWRNYDYPRSQASGYYQFEPDTWRTVAQQSGDAEAQKYPEAYLAPQAAQDRMARWLLQRYGPNADISWAASGKDRGRPYPNVDPSSFASNQPGHTRTGDSKAPNPDGNAPPPQATQQGPEGVAVMQ